VTRILGFVMIDGIWWRAAEAPPIAVNPGAIVTTQAPKLLDTADDDKMCWAPGRSVKVVLYNGHLGTYVYGISHPNFQTRLLGLPMTT
jgi:hypothetical protein